MSRTRQKFRSRFEGHVAARLDELGVKWEYETHALQYWKPFRNGVCGDCGSGNVTQERWYYPDFWLPEYECHLEAKGNFGQTVRMKMRLVKQAHPDEDIRMVFMRDNYIGRKSVTRTRYTDYAKKYGMPAVVLENLEDLL